MDEEFILELTNKDIGKDVFDAIRNGCSMAMFLHKVKNAPLEALLLSFEVPQYFTGHFDTPLMLSPLFAAVWFDKPGFLKILLDKGCDPNTALEHDMTPLHYCAIRNRDRCAQILMDHGADIDNVNTAGLRPLALAASNFSRETAITLDTYKPQLKA